MPALIFDQPPKSICILRLSAIGDVTHVLPIIATLKKQWPETSITWIIGKLEYQLVKSLSDIDFIVFDKRNGLGEYRKLHQSLKGSNFDVLLMMQVSLRANFLSLLIRTPIKIGYDKSRARDFHSLFINQNIEGPSRIHVLDTFFQFLKKLGINERTMDWLLTVDEKDREFAYQIISERPTVIINPCSSARKNNWRNWPVNSYVEVVDYLSLKNIQVILSGGPSTQEISYANDIVQICRQPPINLVGKTTLSQLLALMQQAQCLIAPDTGPAHMGTVAGIPVIGLYASSNPLRTGPYNSQDCSVNAYPEALEKYNQQNVEQARWGARVRDQDVMKSISIKNVINKLNQCLGLSQDMQ